MSDFLKGILISFSQAIFSSPALDMIATGVSSKAIHFQGRGWVRKKRALVIGVLDQKLQTFHIYY